MTERSARARVERERRTIEAMISMYCRDHHGPGEGGLCDGCEALRAYAGERLDRCVFKLEKPTCVKCPVHCYRAEMREAVRVVMRYAGPRMLREHPVLAIRHVVDGWKKAPEHPRRRKQAVPV